MYVLSYKVYCAYIPSNGAMALLNKISVFRILSLPNALQFHLSVRILKRVKIDIIVTDGCLRRFCQHGVILKTTKFSAVCGRTAGHWLWKRPSPVPCVDEQQVTDCENDQVQYHVWTNSRSLWKRPSPVTLWKWPNPVPSYHVWSNSRASCA